MQWLNRVLKDLENSRKRYLENVKKIQKEIKHVNIIKKQLKNNYE